MVLEVHYADKTFDVNALSRLLCLCPMQVYRMVRRHTGLPPGKYLLLFRLAKAMHLLHTTELGIGEIAWQTGFGSPNNFTRAFHRVLGYCPLHLRREWEVINGLKEVKFGLN